jgi:hypothetical protein
MEAALTIIGTILVSLIIWALTHSARCADFHERLARLEERLGMKQ